MGSRPERANGHIGIEIRPRLLREAAVKNLAQWAKACRSDAAWTMKVFVIVKSNKQGRISKG